MTRRLAVVVLHWKGREDTLRCLDSLRGEIGPEDAVWLVDNGSTDGAPAAARAAHPGIRVIVNGSNLGYAEGNNVGIRAALDEGYAWVLLLNSDAAVEKGALAALVAYGDAHPEVGSLQALLLSEGEPPRIDSLGLRPFRSFGCEDVARGRPAAEAPADPVPIFAACGAASLYRASTLRATGVLDGDLFLFCEDLDIGFRVRASGAEIRLVPAARVRHRRGISVQQVDPAAARRRKFWLQRNNVAMALRWWPKRWLLLYSPLLLWRMTAALWLSAHDPAHPCLPHWGKYLGERRRSRDAFTRAGGDAWFA